MQQVRQFGITLGVFLLVIIAAGLFNGLTPLLGPKSPEESDREVATMVARMATNISYVATVNALPEGGQLLFGPEDGSISPADETRPAAYTDIYAGDFIAEARFYNSSGPWNYGFVFREMLGQGEQRVYVDSEANWYHVSVSLVDDKLKDTLVASGPVTNLNSHSAGSNLLQLTAKGPGGSLAVNGVQVTTLDLSGSHPEGSSSTAAGFGERSVSPRYEGFRVWSVY